MKTLLHSSGYWDIFYHTDLKLIDCQIKESDSDDAIFQREMIIYAGFVEQFQAPLLLVNLANGTYTMHPEIQEWVAQEIAPRVYVAGQRKIAMVLSTDIFAQVSVEQMMGEKQIADVMETLYFDSNEAAMNWLRSL